MVDSQMVVAAAALLLGALSLLHPRARQAFLGWLRQGESSSPTRGTRRSRPSHAAPHLPTASGVLVRSRPEQVIADWLFKQHIRFNYEQPIGVRNFKGNETWRSADFFLPEHGVYWEHFGMWDNAAYQAKARRKLRMYHDSGYRVICTFGGPPSHRTMAKKLAEHSLIVSDAATTPTG